MAGKKGEVEITHLIGLILAIVGFVIVLALLWSIEFNNFTDEDTCKLSVLSRATAPSGTQGYVPLKCTTKKICLTFSDDCEQFRGEKGVTKIKLSKSDAEGSAREIEKVTAEETYKCWDMMGQGKLDLFNGGRDASVTKTITGWGDFEVSKSSCVICSRVAVSKQLRESPEGEAIMNKVDVNKYMESELVPGSKYTYIETFTDRQVQSYPVEFKENFEITNNGMNQMGIVFMQILTKKGVAESFFGTTTGTGAFLFGFKSMLGPFGKIVGNKILAAVSVSAGAVAAFQTWGGRAVSAAYCGGLKRSDSEAPENGCSIVTGMNYDNISEINNFCSVIEGSP